MDNLAEAKELFRAYLGSHYFMSREDMYKTYQAFQVPQETEQMWRREMQEEYRARYLQEANLSTKALAFDLYAILAGQSKDAEGDLRWMVKELKRNAEQLDTNTLVRHVNAICNFISNLPNKRKRISIAGQMRQILQRAWEQPIWISEDYKQNGEFPDHLTVDRVAKSMQEVLRFCEQLEQ